MPDLPIPSDPVKLAVVGSGGRSTRIYGAVIKALAPWIEVVAVCDPVREHADAYAEKFDVTPFYDIHELVRAKPMEAALVVTPVPSHHALSVYLSSNGIHNMPETSMCSLLAQGREMIDVAAENGVVMRIAENFFRFPIDRIVQQMTNSDLLGPMRRVVSYNDHTGYHNNSRWLVLCGDHPVAVQSIEHDMNTVDFTSLPHRPHSSENYHSRHLWFPDGTMVMDHASNAKGFLGRHPRPGYTEWHHERGAVVHRALQREEGWVAQSEVRYVSDDGLQSATGNPDDHRHAGGLADQTFELITDYDGLHWVRTYVDLPTGRVEYANPYPAVDTVFGVQDINPFPNASSTETVADWYLAAVMGHVVDFALAVRGLAESEFSPEDALMALAIEVASRESVLNDGARIRMPLGDTEAERQRTASEKEIIGVDPMDVEAVLSLSFPKP